MTKTVIKTHPSSHWEPLKEVEASNELTGLCQQNSSQWALCVVTWKRWKSAGLKSLGEHPHQSTMCLYWHLHPSLRFQFVMRRLLSTMLSQWALFSSTVWKNDCEMRKIIGQGERQRQKEKIRKLCTHFSFVHSPTQEIKWELRKQIHNNSW